MENDRKNHDSLIRAAEELPRDKNAARPPLDTTPYQRTISASAKSDRVGRIPKNVADYVVTARPDNLRGGVTGDLKNELDQMRFRMAQKSHKSLSSGTKPPRRPIRCDQIAIARDRNP